MVGRPREDRMGPAGVDPRLLGSRSALSEAAAPARTSPGDRA